MHIHLTRRDLLMRSGQVAAGLGVLNTLEMVTSRRVSVVEAATVQQTNADRAVPTYNAMQQWMYAGDGSSLYRETSPATGNPYSYLWPFSRALLGTLALAGVPASLVAGASFRSAAQDRLAALSRYWDATASVPAYDSYVLGPYGSG